MLAAISNGLRVYFLVNFMNKVEQSLWIEANYPATDWSIVRRKAVFGVAINDASYITQPVIGDSQVIDPCYRAWKAILRRSYYANFHRIQPTYIGVTVCNEWLKFSSFREWWLENHIDGWELDKDLLLHGSKHYSKESCVYVPKWLNRFVNTHDAARGGLPIGVSYEISTCKFRASCRDTLNDKLRYLGLFDSPESAHEAWLTHKLDLAGKLKPHMDAIDPRIYHNVVTIIKAAR